MANDRDKIITSTELQYILETNKKAITVYLEVEKQNEEIVKAITKLDERAENTEKHVMDTYKSTVQIETLVEKIDKNIFRLIIILGSAGAGLLYTIIQSFIHH